jgi:phospholipid/cholesterol/gamma-HCH transport system substrate-binding protein
MKISREAKIGALVLIVIALFIWGFNFLKGVNILNRTQIYKMEFDNVGELSTSAGVYVSGYKIGSVKDIYFKEGNTGKIIVEIIIKEDLMIPKNSVGQIYSKDLMGTKGIRLIFSDSKEYYKTGDVLISDVEIGLMDQLMPLKNKVAVMIEGIDSILKVAEIMLDKRTIRDMRSTLSNLESFTGNLAAENLRLAAIFKNVESLTSNLKNNNEKLNNLMMNLSNISDSLAQSQIKSTMIQANQAITQMQEVIQKINSGEGTLGQLVKNDTLYYNLQNASKNMDLLLLDLKDHPKRYVQFSIFGKKEAANKN